MGLSGVWAQSRAHGPDHRAEMITLACFLQLLQASSCLSPFFSEPSALLRRRRVRPGGEAAAAAAMGSMTIGAKYKTTLKDPGTPGVLRMVRATLPSRPVLSPSLPEAPLSVSLPSLFPLLPACAHGSRWGASNLRDAPLLRAGVLVGFWGARGELNRGLGGDLPLIGSAEVEARSDLC